MWSQKRDVLRSDRLGRGEGETERHVNFLLLFRTSQCRLAYRRARRTEFNSVHLSSPADICTARNDLCLQRSLSVRNGKKNMYFYVSEKRYGNAQIALLVKSKWCSINAFVGLLYAWLQSAVCAHSEAFLLAAGIRLLKWQCTYICFYRWILMPHLRLTES